MQFDDRAHVFDLAKQTLCGDPFHAQMQSVETRFLQWLRYSEAPADSGRL
jgi:hypothetical protein